MFNPTLIEVLRDRARRRDGPCQAERREVIGAVAEDVAQEVWLGPRSFLSYDPMFFAYARSLRVAFYAHEAACQRPDSLRRSQLAADALELAIRIKALMIEEAE